MWAYLMSELAEASTWVREEAIPRLVTRGELPRERIPASYNIGRGHEDERLAVGSGTLTTADERVRLRHAAASARLSLVDVIVPTSGDLTREYVSEWLAQHDDGQVIQRVEKRRGFVSDLGSMSENARIVAELGQEAQQFAKRQRD